MRRLTPKAQTLDTRYTVLDAWERQDIGDHLWPGRGASSWTWSWALKHGENVDTGDRPRSGIVGFLLQSKGFGLPGGHTSLCGCCSPAYPESLLGLISLTTPGVQ